MAWMMKGIRVILPDVGMVCSVCGHHEETLLNKEEVYGDLEYGMGTEPPEYLPQSPFCSHCAMNAEREFVNGMSIEELPLWVSHLWIYMISDDRYLKRLREGV